MEYLTRVLNVVQEYEEFKYHPLCKQLKLSHLCFADDLLLFCKGDGRSIVLLLRAFATFSAASGLKMNDSKSNIYGNGMIQGLLQEVADLSGLKVGTLPFKYLSVPIAPRKLSVLSTLHSRKLSYAETFCGKGIFMQMHQLWFHGRVFVLLRSKEVWGLLTLFSGIVQLWGSIYGGLCRRRTTCGLSGSIVSISNKLIGMFMNLQLGLAGPGVVFADAKIK
ncbi:uncharacterized protein LOC141630492 [Silene latifolia]|uniref:uncharacterized protein LOC141630492 n=1 Tax=Silene latifolia TaxID=37657 RepID=UPI003D76D4CC